MSFVERPKHGGEVASYVQRYGIPRNAWLDLSTGINPNSYPVADLPVDVWRDLPSEQDGLLEVAQGYYASSSLALVPGSQWMISQLPMCFESLLGNKTKRVLVPANSYREYAYCFSQGGFNLDFYDQIPSDEQLDQCDICVVINPNNPSGYLLPLDQLLQIKAWLSARDACLLVDEAFIDVNPANSMSRFCGMPGLIVLRSFGKFFGLAGLRMGAVVAWPGFLERLSLALGPWAINHPAREIARRALADKTWQNQTRTLLNTQSQRLADLLKQSFDIAPQGCGLFQTLKLDGAIAVHEGLCRQGILTRLLDDQSGIRFGLPANQPEVWARLESALQAVQEQGVAV